LTHFANAAVRMCKTHEKVFQKVPQLLIVVCNRFRYDPIDGGKKIMTTLEFQDTISIESKSADHKISNQLQFNAVVRHIGSSLEGGHYIADIVFMF
jgi:ubiquitin C-terminal hydrolase